jgi:RHS repeat-associated core domain
MFRRVGVAILVVTLASVSLSAESVVGAATSQTADAVPLAAGAPPDAKPAFSQGDSSVAPGAIPVSGQTQDTKPRVSFDAKSSREVPALTSPTAETFKNADGTQTLVANQVPVRFKDATGTWQPIDNSLVPDGAGGLRPKSSSSLVHVGGSASGAVATVVSSAGPIQIMHPDGAAVAAIVEGVAASYPDGLGRGKDLVEASIANGIEESVQFASPDLGSGYQITLQLPDGVTARQGKAGGLEIVTSDGRVIATMGDGVATDSNVGRAGNGAQAVAPVTLLGQIGSVATVGVDVDAKWWTDSTRVFPITIDPLLHYVDTNTGDNNIGDTFIQSAFPTQGYWSSDPLKIGADPGLAGDVARSYIRWDLGSAPAANKVVTEAHLALHENWSGGNCASPTAMEVWGLGQWLGPYTTPNSQPVTDGWGPGWPLSSSAGAPGCAPDWVIPDVTGIAGRWMNLSEGNAGVLVKAVNESDTFAWKKFNSNENPDPSSYPALYITYDTLPDQAVPTAPADQAVVSTVTPTLSVAPMTDPDPGDSVRANFSVSTGPGGSGQVVQSGWLPYGQTSWTPPDGTLQDGVTYYWNVGTNDGCFCATTPNWTRTFKVDLRLGARGPLPYDTAGPVTVNLSNGNAVTAISSPSYTTAGGSIGATYTYNSQSPVSKGLTGYYYNHKSGNAHFDYTGESSVLVRRDTSVNFNWGSGSPYPSVNNDSFDVRWQGKITVPSSGNYTFGGGFDDGTQIKINGTTVLGDGPAGIRWGTPVALTGGTPVDITIDYYENTGGASIDLQVSGTLTGGGTVAQQQVNSTWLSPDGPILPQGWTFSAGGDLGYTSATVVGTQIIVRDTAGDTHAYQGTIYGYLPPKGEEGVLTRNDTNGEITLHAADGMTYVFDVKSGQLKSGTSGSDDSRPMAPQYTYTQVSGLTRLTKITDPVSTKFVTLTYGGGACPTYTSPYDLTAPTGMLCKIDFTQFGGGTSSLYYLNTQLAKIVDPDAVTTTLGYGTSGNSAGLLNDIRDPLANDYIRLLGLGTSPANSDTTIVYNSNKKVSSVTLPAPTAGGAASTQPQHSYSYTPSGLPSGAQVHIAGLTEPNGYARQVVYDTTGRVTADTDADGYTSNTTWSTDDQVLTRTDAGHRRTTYQYDVEHRLRDVYGPAPDVCTLPNTCPAPYASFLIPHTKTEYDTNPDGTPYLGLAATYWNTTSFTNTGTGTNNAPVVHHFGLTDPQNATYVDPSGMVYATWGTSSIPVKYTNITAGQWSTRLTGEINVTTAGNQNIQFFSVGYAALYIDDVLTPTNSWFDNTGTWSSLVTSSYSVGKHRIRIDFKPGTGAPGPRLELWWQPPGAQARDAVPGANLFPRYGLATRTRVTDPALKATDVITASDFTLNDGQPHPEKGLATAVTADYGGLGLTTTTAYEPLSATTGHLRPLTKTLPGGTVTSYNYYTDTGNPPTTGGWNSCAGTNGTNQGGLLKQQTDASGIQHDFVYDLGGHTLANRVDTDATWTCATYDTRDRNTTTTYPDRTVTNTYETAADPLGANLGGITSRTDMLGRPVFYDDALNLNSLATTYAYDQPGRLTDTTVPTIGTGTTALLHTIYTAAGRVSSQQKGPNSGSLQDIATAGYNATSGDLDVAVYPSPGANSTYGAFTRDPAGRTQQVTWVFGNGAVTDAVTYSQAGKITTESSTDSGASAQNSAYLYDAVGRLTIGVVPGHWLGYKFDTTNTCGANLAAGQNSNRTSLTDSAGPTVNYCYDNGDRLTSTTDAAVGTPAYDTHGRTTTIGSGANLMTFKYDAADRHTETDLGTGATMNVKYTYDNADRLLTRSTGSGSTLQNCYGYTGPGDSPDLVTGTTSGACSTQVVEHAIPLIGGTMLTLRTSGSVWSYRNIHGDVMATTDGAGTKVGNTFLYDPFGQPLSASPAGPDNAAGTLDYGWLGQNQRGTESGVALPVPVVEMGARIYLPKTGRFLEIDPVVGGSCNDYDYTCGDPVNGSDLTGNCISENRRCIQPRPSPDRSNWLRSLFLWFSAVPHQNMGTGASRGVNTAGHLILGRGFPTPLTIVATFLDVLDWDAHNPTTIIDSKGYQDPTCASGHAFTTGGCNSGNHTNPGVTTNPNPALAGDNGEDNGYPNCTSCDYGNR